MAHGLFVSVNRNFSQFRYVVSGIPQSNVLGELLSILYTAMRNDFENKILYADDTILYA